MAGMCEKRERPAAPVSCFGNALQAGDERAAVADRYCARAEVAQHFVSFRVTRARGRNMREQEVEFDYCRYRQLLAEAVDEKKRLALIDLLIQEQAMERLAAQRASDRAAKTAATIAKVVGTPRR
jgi:hypothetical protein